MSKGNFDTSDCCKKNPRCVAYPRPRAEGVKTYFEPLFFFGFRLLRSGLRGLQEATAHNHTCKKKHTHISFFHLHFIPPPLLILTPPFHNNVPKKLKGPHRWSLKAFFKHNPGSEPADSCSTKNIETKEGGNVLVN